MSTITNIEPVAIRPARDADRAQLVRLAELDSAVVPAGPLLVAELGDAIRAAVALEGRETIADPFYPTAELVTLLRTRAGQAGRRPARLRIVARSPVAA